MKEVALFILFILLILPVSARAQTATISSSANQATASGVLSANITQSVNLFMVRLKGGVFRADNISQRIGSRLSKISLSGQVSTGSATMTKLDTQQKTLVTQLSKLKNDLSQLDLQAQIFTVSTTPQKDYLLFKSQALAITKNLKDIYKVELDMIISIKQLATVTATSVVQPVSITP